MSSPYYVPAGPEAAPTSQTLQPATSPTLTAHSLSSSGSTNLSRASAALIAVFLSLFALATLGMFGEVQRRLSRLMLYGEAAVICWTRRRRTAQRVSDQQPLERVVVRDVEALTSAVPVTPRPDVRWAPQIRSISGPPTEKGSDRKSATLPSKRVRSPPPPTKPRNLFSDSSAVAHPLSSPQNDVLNSAWSLRDVVLPIIPQALAVSGMQTRSLGKSGGRSETQ